MAEIIFPDVANAFAKVQSIQSNALRERLLMTQANREEETYQRDKQARALYPAAISGDATAKSKLAGLSPEHYHAIQKMQSEGRTAQLAEIKTRTDLLGQGAAAILSVPIEQRPATYQAQRQRLIATGFFKPQDIPEQYDEAQVTAAANMARSVDAVMKQQADQPRVQMPDGSRRPVSDMRSAPVAPPPAPGGVQPAQNPPAMSPAASQGAAPLPVMPPMPEPEPAPLPAAPPPDRAAVQSQAQWAARGVNPQGLSPAEEARAVSEAARAGARSAMAQRPSPPPTGSGGPPMPVGTAIAAAGPADMPAEQGQPAQFTPPAEQPKFLPMVGSNGLPITENLPPGYRLGFDPVTRSEVLMRIPGAETTEEKAAAEERGRAIGKTQGANAPNPAAAQKADEALRIIEKTKSHPGRSWGTGVTGVIPGIPGTSQRDFVALVDQIKGKAFLEAFESLKGGGQITEAEGKKATDAIARLDRGQTGAGFLEALADLEHVIKVGRARARGEPAPAQPAATTPGGSSPRPMAGPPIGAIEGGYRFKGGNPADRSSWELAR